MHTLTEIVDALPESAWQDGYYGSRNVRFDWAGIGDDLTRNVAPIVDLLPPMDDAEGWSAFAGSIVEQMPRQDLAGDAARALSPVIRMWRKGIFQNPPEWLRIAGHLAEWLSARAFGQVGPHIVEEARTFHYPRTPWYAVREATA